MDEVVELLEDDYRVWASDSETVKVVLPATFDSKVVVQDIGDRLIEAGYTDFFVQVCYCFLDSKDIDYSNSHIEIEFHESSQEG